VRTPVINVDANISYMPIVRKREIENLQQMSGEELQAFLDRLPAGAQTISLLIDYVEDELYDSECNHTLQHAMKFMMDNHLDFPKITSWLNENGGYCDCKVLAEIAPHWRAKFEDD
jgi:hypothetical protein